VLDAAWQDIRYGARRLGRSPLFALTAALSLAIGIGANTTIFAIGSALLLRPLPGVVAPSRLVDIGRTQDGKDFDTSSYPNYVDIRTRATTLSDIYAYRLESQPMGLGGREGADRIYGSVVSANYFTVLGTQPVLGRLLVPADDEGAPGSHPVIVIGYDLWQGRFAGRRDVIGQVVPLNGYPFTIVGVAPRGFQGTTLMRSDVWLPITSAHLGTPRQDSGQLRSRRASWLLLGGRLRDGVTVAQANEELQAIGASLTREFPEENRGRGLRALPSSVVPGHIDVFAGFLGVLMVLVGLVLLIACVNLSGMLLARGAARRREVAVRLAIGASRGRLARQLLTETLLLFAGGCALGLLASRWLRGVLLALLPQLPVPVGIDMPIDFRVLAFAIGISLVAAVAAGLLPALQASSPDVVGALKAEGHGTVGGRLRLRSVFLVGQVAMSLVLVLTAGLFLRALGRAAAVDPGFSSANVDVVVFDLSLAQYTDTTGPVFVDRLLARTSSLPGVRSAALVTDLPLDGGRMGFGSVRTPGYRRGDSDRIDADWNVVSPGAFRTLELRLVRGRDFTDADRAGAPRVVIVNEAMARAVWGTTDAVGRTVEVNDSDVDRWETATVVGVAADAHLIGLDAAAEPYIYVPLAQRYAPRLALLVKTQGATAIPGIRAIFRELNPNLPVNQALPLEEVTAVGLIPQRIVAAVAGSLGLVGLLLAAIGIYGVAAYNVARRIREIGVRVALGADRRSILALVLRQGLGLTAAGVLLGVIAGGVLAQVLRALLFGVGALDPVAFGIAAAIFLLVAAAATAGPAWRAARVDPMQALRTE
jgi:predicted permease